jgi:hypothetical protein
VQGFSNMKFERGPPISVPVCTYCCWHQNGCLGGNYVGASVSLLTSQVLQHLGKAGVQVLLNRCSCPSICCQVVHSSSV